MTDWMNCCMVLQMDWIDEKIGSIGWKNLRKGGFSQSFVQSSISVSGLRNPRHLTLAVMPSGTGGAVVLVGVASCNAEGTCRTGQGGGRPPGAEGTSRTEGPVGPHGAPITVVPGPALPCSARRKVRRTNENIPPAGLLS